MGVGSLVHAFIWFGGVFVFGTITTYYLVFQFMSQPFGTQWLSNFNGATGTVTVNQFATWITLAYAVITFILGFIIRPKGL